MKRTRNRISSLKDRMKSETKKTIDSFNGGFEKMENNYELVFKVKPKHLNQ